MRKTCMILTGESNVMGLATITASLIGLAVIILLVYIINFILKIIDLSEDEQEKF